VRPGRAADPLTPFQCRGLGRVELYLYPSLGHNQACYGVTYKNEVHLYCIYGVTRTDGLFIEEKSLRRNENTQYYSNKSKN